MTPPAVRGERGRARPVAAALALVAALTSAGAVSSGCGTLATGPTLSSTLESPDALARAVVGALTTRDLARLQALAVTEKEFRTLVWPYLPASQPILGLPVDYAWRDHATKSAADLRTTLERHGGRALHVVEVASLGETTEYGPFRIRRDTVVTVRDEAGETARLRLFGSVIEQAGRVKVFSYIVD